MWLNPAPPSDDAAHVAQPAPTTLSIETDRAAGHGGIIWDASLLLARFICTNAALFGPAARCIELGAGAGLPGLTAARAHGCTVVLTDKPPLLPLLAANAARNGLGCTVAPLLWGGALRRLPPAARPPWDVVLCADLLGCADGGDAFDSLLKTLRDALAANPAAVVLMSWRPRAAWEAAFFERAAGDEGWAVSCVAVYTRADVAAVRASALLALQPELGERSPEGLLESAACNDDGGLEHAGDPLAAGSGAVVVLKISAAPAAGARPRALSLVAPSQAAILAAREI